MRLARALAEQGGDVRYGLVECRCFVFPVVEGILLLSLSKGYGGAEEALQPYVPLQAAAVHFLGRDRVDALQDWMRRHVPLAAPFLDRDAGTFLEYSSRMAGRLELEVAAYLDEYGRFGVLGNPGGPRRRLLRRARNLLRRPRSGRAHELEQLTQFYPARFFSPYAQSTMMQLGQLPLSGPVLSLCCGHGMFENLLDADGRAADVVSMDGQFLNLLVTKHFVRPQGQFICHDLQLGLPFRDGAFQAVFSSTCLPEIPAQRLFTREAIRVTARDGWTWFDCVWNGESGGPRIARDRHYRFSQNFFARLEDYWPFFRECAQGREVAIGVPSAPQAYIDGASPWSRGPDAIGRLLGERAEVQLSALVVDPAAFAGFVSQPLREWLTAERLAPCPAYDAAAAASRIELRRRPGFERLAATFAPRAFPGYPAMAAIERGELEQPAALLQRYCAGHLSVLPARFDRGPGTLRDLIG